MSLEQRFFRATAVYTEATPAWLLQIDRSYQHLDAKGVAAVAFVRYPYKLHPVRVPIQIRSSQAEVAKYFASHPWAKAAKLVCLIIRQDESSEAIRKNFYNALNLLRISGFDPTPALESREDEPVDAEGQRLQQEVVNRRSYEPHFDFYLRPTLPLMTRFAQWYK